jgi:hypothetical protein
MCKCHQTLEAVRQACPQSLPADGNAAERYAAGLLCDYLHPDWAAHLLQCLAPAAAGSGDLCTQDAVVAKHITAAPAAGEAKRAKVRCCAHVVTRVMPNYVLLHMPVTIWSCFFTC